MNLMSIAGIDGNISEDEKNVIVNIAQDLGLTEEEFDKCIGIWQNVDETKLETIVPDSVDEAYQFLKNMVLVMMIDGEIDENERAYIAGRKRGSSPDSAHPGRRSRASERNRDCPCRIRWGNGRSV